MTKILFNRKFIFLTLIIIFSGIILISKPKVAFATPKSECTHDYGPVNCTFRAADPNDPACNPMSGSCDGYCSTGCKSGWIEGDCPVGVPCNAQQGACKCGNGDMTCYQLLPTLTPTPTPLPENPLCTDLISAPASTGIKLGDPINLTCSKNASYLDAVTFNFRLIQKPNAASPDPNPLPAPFVSGSASATVPYQLPTDQYGYYLFQCQVCANAFCTAWQSPSAQ